MKISFNVVARRTLYVGLACILVIASIALVVFKGFNLGIDFESGLSVSVRVENSSIEDVRAAVSSIEGVRVQNVGSSDDGRYQIRAKVSEGQDQRDVEALVNELLGKSFSSYTILESSFIGAKFSSSLITGSIKAVAIALALILVYVWVRFRVAYAIGSIVALIHDVVLLFGFISLMGFEISSTTIAAVLTIIGYSLNNTIVIFDRVRESIKGDNTQELSTVIDYGVNSSLSRTTFSSGTTLLAVVPGLFCFRDPTGVGHGDLLRLQSQYHKEHHSRDQTKNQNKHSSNLLPSIPYGLAYVHMDGGGGKRFPKIGGTVSKIGRRERGRQAASRGILRRTGKNVRRNRRTRLRMGTLYDRRIFALFARPNGWSDQGIAPYAAVGN